MTAAAEAPVWAERFTGAVQALLLVGAVALLRACVRAAVREHRRGGGWL